MDTLEFSPKVQGIPLIPQDLTTVFNENSDENESSNS